MHSLFISLHTLVQLDDVAADEPDQVTEIRDRRLVPDVVQHVLVVHWRRRGGRERSSYRGDAQNVQLKHTPGDAPRISSRM